MKIRLTRLAALGLFLLLVSPSAFAQWGDASDIPTYLNGDVGRSYQRNLNVLLWINTEDADNSDIEFDINLQLLITDYFTLTYQGGIETATVNGPDGVAGLVDPDAVPNNGDEYNDDLPPGFVDTKVYRRVRTAGSMTIVQGTPNQLNLQNVPVLGTQNLNLFITVTGDSSVGYFTAGHPTFGTRWEWSAVGDFSMVRDNFGIPRNTPANINITGLSLGTLNISNPQVGAGLSLDHGTVGGGQWL